MIDIDILFTFHESTIKTNRSINIWNQNKLIPGQVHEWCLIQAGQNHCVTTKAQKDMALFNKQRNKSSTDSKFMHMNNINTTMLIFSFVRLGDKHRLLGLC